MALEFSSKISSISLRVGRGENFADSADSTDIKTSEDVFLDFLEEEIWTKMSFSSDSEVRLTSMALTSSSRR